MIYNATNPLRESRKESLLRCAGSTSICEWLVEVRIWLAQELMHSKRLDAHKDPMDPLEQVAILGKPPVLTTILVLVDDILFP